MVTDIDRARRRIDVPPSDAIFPVSERTSALSVLRVRENRAHNPSVWHPEPWSLLAA